MKIDNLFEDLTPGELFLNEIHYDNDGGDVGEFIEIKSIDPAETFANVQVDLYNGSNGTVYNTLTVADGTVTSDGSCSYLKICLPTNGLQNGAPDGLAISNNGTVCEFVSYEGTFMATEGPANGTTSTDIGIAETGGTPIGSSLQIDPATGMWIVADETPGTANECFVNGTNILTDKGEVKVENLNIGDIVVTMDGKHIPIKWIGKQRIDISKEINKYPVRINKNALAPNVPSQDLFVSEDHAIFIDNLLINAGALVNGNSISEVKPSSNFTYFHVELDQHALIIAENLPAESYLPQKQNRDTFDNGKTCDMKESNVLLWPLKYPRISSQFKVPNAIKNKLNKIATRKAI